MKNDLTTGAWQHNIGCPISIVLFSTSDALLPPYTQFMLSTQQSLQHRDVCLPNSGRPAHQKHAVDMDGAGYYHCMRNIEQACFTALYASVNNAFKVSNDPPIQGWHTGMQVIDILDQLSTIYSQSTRAILKTNDTVFHSPHLAANAPEVLFCQIEECAETALLGRNPYMDQQLMTNTIHLLLTTGLYTQPFEDWDCLMLGAQTWIALQTMIQEAFQQTLNAIAPAAGHQGYAPTMPHQQNTYGILGQN
jgi:hypothetical protein